MTLEWKTGRWERVDGRQLPRHQRLCTLCLADQVEDEFYMVFKCAAYESVSNCSESSFGICLMSLEIG
jgi:hypothetical protein